jgi:asparagine synthase (glutamine-hydrolysing)
MSAMALLLDRTSGHGDRAQEHHATMTATVAAMLRAIPERGPDGAHTQAVEGAVLGAARFAVGPDDAEAAPQPLRDAATGAWLCFDGRVDNRRELCATLGESPTASDAALVLAAFRRWGDAAPDRLVGPFALAYYQPQRRRLTLARDPTGGRTLFLHLADGWLAAASEERALLAHPSIDDALDERRIVRYLSVGEPDAGSTFFRHLRQLDPGQRWVVTPDRVQRERLEPIRPDRQLRQADQRERAERLHAVLSEAVHCRLRAPGKPAVMMSGGLDSTSVAALAAAHHGAGVLAVSWVFDHRPSCDERRFITPMLARHALTPVQVSGDDGWPLSDLERWPFNPNTPEENLYRRLPERAYTAARQAGARVMLTGMFGDHLYTGHQRWLAELLGQGHPMRAASEVLWHLARRHRGPTLRAALSSMLASRRRPAAAGTALPAWLTPEAQALLCADHPDALATGPASAPAAGVDRPDQYDPNQHRPSQYQRILGPLAARSVTMEIFHTARAGIELRNPYRDRRLIALMLGLPAYDLYHRGLYKPLLRRAMAGELPAAILQRRQPTELTPLFERGIRDRRHHWVRTILQRPDAQWSRFVRPDWLLGEGAARAGGAGDLVLWGCLCLELWLARRRGQGQRP